MKIYEKPQVDFIGFELNETISSLDPEQGTGSGSETVVNPW